MKFDCEADDARSSASPGHRSDGRRNRRACHAPRPNTGALNGEKRIGLRRWTVFLPRRAPSGCSSTVGPRPLPQAREPLAVTEPTCVALRRRYRRVFRNACERCAPPALFPKSSRTGIAPGNAAGREMVRSPRSKFPSAGPARPPLAQSRQSRIRIESVSCPYARIESISLWYRSPLRRRSSVARRGRKPSNERVVRQAKWNSYRYLPRLLTAIMPVPGETRGNWRPHGESNPALKIENLLS